MFEQFETIENKLKFQAFGKRKLNKEPKKKGPEVNDETINRDNHENAKELLKMKQVRLDKEMEKIRASAPGRIGQVFKVVNAVQGNKKDKTNPHAIKHPVTVALIVNPEQIKKVSVEYCKENLRNN